MVRFGIDIDDVLVPSKERLLKIAWDELGICMHLDDCREYWVGDNLGLSSDEIEDFLEVQRSKGFIMSLEVDPVAKEVINSYSSIIEPYYITARYEILKADTYDWFASSGLNYSPENVYFKEKKADLAADLGLEFFVEDKGETAFQITNKGITVFLMKYRWNEEFRDNPLVYPIDGWQDISDFMKGFAGF